MENDRAPHASPGNGEADQAGTFLSSEQNAALPDDFIASLREMGMVVGLGEEEAVRRYEREFGFFRLGGFCSAIERNGAFLSESDFSSVAETVELDASIRSLLFDAISQIEVTFRAVLSHELAERYGAFALYDSAVFENLEYFGSLQKTLQRELKQGREYQLPFIEDGLERYGALPVWAAVELMSFGTASKVYKNLSDRDVSVRIARFFGVKSPLMKNWLRYITQVRNMCAHQNRLYGCRFVFTPRLFREHASVDKHRLFPIFIVLFHLMDGVRERKANAFRQRLDSIMRAHPHVDLRPLGFPRNWRELLGLLGPAGQQAPRQRGKNGGRPSVDAQALAEALHLYDMKQLTVAQIAQRTGISQPTIYKYVRKRKEEEAARTEYAVVPL